MYPKTIYELLPLLYFIVGIWALLRLEHVAGQVAGTVLIVAAILVHQWRRTYRREK